MFGRLICYFKGHKRGRRLHISELTPKESQQGCTAYRCPRCGATWARKIKAKETA